jgi:endonuclease III
MKKLQNIEQVHEKLKTFYSDFNHRNKKNPYNELLFIICSLKTQEMSYEKNYITLKKKYPSFNSIRFAKLEEIEKAIHPGGLSNQKAKIIFEANQRIYEHFGKLTLSPLAKFSDKDCETFLTSLKGIGLKTARCIMMYSLGREVFPVDSHVWRISKRLGWNESKKIYRNCRDEEMNELQDVIPTHYRYSLHVNLVSLGRDYCTSMKPKCGDCPLNTCCPRIY